jgi:uncharacterized membrane protein
MTLTNKPLRENFGSLFLFKTYFIFFRNNNMAYNDTINNIIKMEDHKMKKKDFKLFKDTALLNGLIIVELIMSVLLIRQKKWYSTFAGISLIVEAGEQMGKATKLLNKTDDRLETMGFDEESEEETTKSDKIQMGFHV